MANQFPDFTVSSENSSIPRGPALIKISVVTSAYNNEDRIQTSVDSILNQSFRELELIIVNDGSTDRTGSILDHIAARDNRVRVIHQQNQGLTRALIRGCKGAVGEVIARQDADDWSHPDRLTEQWELLQSDPFIGMVSCHVEYVGPQEEHLSYIERPADAEQATFGLIHQEQGPPAHGSLMFRRSLYESVGGYRTEFHFAQDADLWLRMAAYMRISYVQRHLYIHHRDIHSTSGKHYRVQKQFGELGQLCHSARLNGRSEDEFLCQARHLSELIRSGQCKSALRGNLIDATYALGSQLVSNGDKRARSYLWQVIRSRPWHGKAWIRLLQSGMHSLTPHACKAAPHN